ncbi:TraB/GumN family protein [Flavobacterium capsici]|uniref:TraB/GumN family protein n=1 Tax=Flavobacterium capsici TaxID=3075618 RepID=A0AA96F3I6_9FLAO|nr:MULTISPECIES: TraB/GumN family protein [unclassified Flavobacterium]WNM18859.1 TraB/GumN family protein [Flavobacterium sp. PMR2A8]WNM22909.1 TraB/GumN family protein [Flavobacterium sp. PMTSA4]
MKKLALLLSLLLASFSNGQTEKKSLLWKISGNGLTKESYLFGTIHISCDASLPKKVLTALDKTEQLCLELDMDDPNMQLEMMSKMMMRDGVTIQSLMSAEDFKLVDDFFKKQSGFSLKMMNTVKPFALSAMLYPKMLDCPMQSYETELMKVAKAQNEETIGLETFSEQLAVFDAIPYQTQVNELIKTAKSDLDRDKKELQEMLDLYKTEDVEALIKYTEKSDNELTSGFMDELLNNRNSNWIERIEKIAKDKPTFFGVGAAHLGGQKGVIKLLQQKGYKVEAVF